MACKYKGIRFYARGVAANGLRLKIADQNTARWGGVCDVGAGTCDDHWGRNLEVGTEWRLYEVLWSDLDQGSANRFGPLLTSKIYGVEFLVWNTPSFEVFIDDVSFIP